MSPELTGWMLDLYADHSASQDGLVLWLLEEPACPPGADLPAAEPARRRLTQSFPVTFYAAGPGPRLRQLWQHLQSQPLPVELTRTERRDLFQPQPVTVLAIEVKNPAHQPALFVRLCNQFPDLTYYDADISLSLRHAARFGTFPLAHLQVTTDSQHSIQAIQVLDSPWDLEPEPPPLRSMTIEPDCNPTHRPPRWLEIRIQRWRYRLPLASFYEPELARPLLVNLAAILNRHDPDLLLTAWGDTWLLPRLLDLSERWNIPLPLSRDPRHPCLRKKARSYFTYGQIIHRGQQVLLFGRWHIDMYNAMMFHDYRLEGILESARVTATPVQDAARLSPGSGISAMQIATALRQGILVPWRKQQAETPKTAMDLIHADQGGLVYQPLVGLHRDVAEIDFISLYPSIMAHFNVSPETTHSEPRSASARRVPELNLWIDGDLDDPASRGLVPQTLQPLLEKRIALKQQAAHLPAWDPRRTAYKARASAHKWLLVTCFGYLGYKNARFGRIEAHQSVTAYSRECLLRAKEAAEDAGCTVLHMYVDGLWVQQPRDHSAGAPLRRDPSDFQPLLEEISRRTRLPVALDGVYRWVAFLPSRVNEDLPVANRYFGVFQDGSLKVRGIEARRGDAPAWIADSQMRILQTLAQAGQADDLPEYLPAILAFLRQQLKLLRLRRLPLENLLVSQKLSRELEEYRTPSPAARAALQLRAVGRSLRPGQRVRFLFTLGDPGVYAWDLPEPPSPAAVNVSRYSELLLRASAAVLQPLGVNETALRNWLFSHASYGAAPGQLPARASASPLLAHLSGALHF